MCACFVVKKTPATEGFGINIKIQPTTSEAVLTIAVQCKVNNSLLINILKLDFSQVFNSLKQPHNY